MSKMATIFTDEDFESMKSKVDLVMSMCGKDHVMKLTVLSYALVFAAMESEVTFASVVKNLAEMCDIQYEESDEGEEE